MIFDDIWVAELFGRFEMPPLAWQFKHNDVGRTISGPRGCSGCMPSPCARPIEMCGACWADCIYFEIIDSTRQIIYIGNIFPMIFGLENGRG